MRPTDGSDIRLSPQALMMLLAAIAGSNVVQALYADYRTQPEVVRPDPFTGFDGRALESRLSERIVATDQRAASLEKRIDALRADLNLCLQHATERR